VTSIYDSGYWYFQHKKKAFIAMGEERVREKKRKRE
jgi:hypothetical protein